MRRSGGHLIWACIYGLIILTPEVNGNHLRNEAFVHCFEFDHVLVFDMVFRDGVDNEFVERHINSIQALSLMILFPASLEDKP